MKIGADIVTKEEMASAIFERPPVGTGHVEISVKVTTEINMTAFAARQKVSGFVLSEISNLMHGGTPVLVVSERLYWRVPVILSFPPHGDLGEVGAIDVDVESGEMQVTQALIREIQERAQTLAARSSP